MPTPAAPSIRRPKNYRAIMKLTLAALLTLNILPGMIGTAAGDVYKDRVNETFKGIADEQRSDKVLLPLLAAIEAPPATVRTQQQAALFGSQGPGFSDLQAWSQKPAQTAIIDALAKVTKEENRTKVYAFAQPYGAEIPDLDLIAKGMYTELGDPELLSAARHLYMPALENMGILVHVEASRLNEAGKTYEALKLLIDWLFFARQIADRPFIKEKRWAMDSMLLAMERMRDVVYVDLKREKHGMPEDKVLELNKRLRDRRGYLALDRIRMPEADIIAREQLLAAVMNSSGNPNPETFGPLLARSSASDRPLRLFSATAYWDNVRNEHANLKQSREVLGMAQGDWAKRWELGFFDRILTTSTDFKVRIAGEAKFAALQQGLSDIEELLPLRHRLKLEVAGTRMALGVYGFFIRNNTFPKSLATTRPDYIESVDADQWSRGGAELMYFIPMRDTPKSSDGSPKPHPVTIDAPFPMPQFQIPLKDNVFVIYSIGPDENNANALTITQTRTAVIGDYLLFPPLLSLHRQRLVENNELK